MEVGPETKLNVLVSLFPDMYLWKLGWLSNGEQILSHENFRDVVIVLLKS